MRWPEPTHLIILFVVLVLLPASLGAILAGTGNVAGAAGALFVALLLTVVTLLVLDEAHKGTIRDLAARHESQIEELRLEHGNEVERARVAAKLARDQDRRRLKADELVRLSRSGTSGRHDFADAVVKLLGGRTNPSKSHDGGIDGWMPDGTPIQVKSSPDVKPPTVSQFHSAVLNYGASKGVIVGLQYLAIHRRN